MDVQTSFDRNLVNSVRENRKNESEEYLKPNKKRKIK